jgi:hypothetical protein
VFVALGIQHAMRMRHILLSSVAYPAVPHISTVPQKRQDFRKEVMKYKIFVLTSCTFVRKVYHFKNNSAR